MNHRMISLNNHKYCSFELPELVSDDTTKRLINNLGHKGLRLNWHFVYFFHFLILQMQLSVCYFLWFQNQNNWFQRRVVLASFIWLQFLCDTYLNNVVEIVPFKRLQNTWNGISICVGLRKHKTKFYILIVFLFFPLLIIIFSYSLSL